MAAAKLGSSQDAGQRQARHGMDDRKRIKDTVASRLVAEKRKCLNLHLTGLHILSCINQKLSNVLYNQKLKFYRIYSENQGPYSYCL